MGTLVFKTSDKSVIKSPETDNISPESNKDCWNILIVDDEEIIHKITKMVLSEVIYKGMKINFISAYSGEEAKQILKEQSNIAIVLLDVVMETDDAGLQVAKFIREELKNKEIRIILRTGQPGQAPEKNVIDEYDINDYKEKTELTSQKLYTCIITGLHSYMDIQTIEKSKKSFEKIIEASRHLFKSKSLEHFTTAVFQQLTILLNMKDDVFYLMRKIIIDDQETIVVISGINEENIVIIDIPLEDINNSLQKQVENCFEQKESKFLENEYFGYVNSNKNFYVIYCKGTGKFSDLDKNILKIFSNDIISAYENLELNREIIATQKEIVVTLGEVIETKSKETANHVKRVAEFAGVIAKKLDFDKETIETLKMASFLHDTGKIGVSENILNKPDKLTIDEFDHIKKHSTVGYEILRHSKRPILKAAAVIAHEHHERWDGTGYPNGKSKEDIHIFARIIAICDVFDALMNKRVYKNPWHLDKVISTIKEGKGTFFDPKIVDIFLENIDTFKEINNKYQ